MSNNPRSILTVIGLLLGVSVDLYCLSKAMPLGLTGDPAVKKWFGLFFGVMIINIALALSYYVQRSKPAKSREEIEIEALAAIGAQMSKDKSRNK